MSGVDTRHISRDSLFLMADFRLEGTDALYRVKVRNLSNGGMMAEADPASTAQVQGGTRLSINLRNIGWVDGTVAWVQDNRFGIAFAREIDASEARAKPYDPNTSDTPRYVRPSSLAPGSSGYAQSLRKI